MVYLIVAVVVFFIVLIYGLARITLKRLPILMYHKVTDLGSPDYLTITTRQLNRQLRYLVKKKYTAIFLSDLLDYLNGKKALPRKPVLITFDDGYKNNYTCLYPLLQEYGMKANIFLVAGFIRSSDNSLFRNEFLHVDDARMMSSETVQFGLHSFEHTNYNDLTMLQVAEDIQKCRARLEQLGIPFEPCLAYTYGAYPKKDGKKRKQLFETLRENDIQLAFRIGNRLNRFPLKNRFLLQRLDIRGDESFSRFKFVLLVGKKMF
jgi:peptidoglycan/xylan/chitin deacetylase (PgdA/CDA1 family)